MIAHPELDGPFMVGATDNHWNTIMAAPQEVLRPRVTCSFKGAGRRLHNSV